LSCLSFEQGELRADCPSLDLDPADARVHSGSTPARMCSGPRIRTCSFAWTPRPRASTKARSRVERPTRPTTRADRRGHRRAEGPVLPLLARRPTVSTPRVVLGGGRMTNSPGYPDGVVNFDRPIRPRCLECHSSWSQSVADSNVVNRYLPAGAILGITCEVCDGSGRDHVAHARSPLSGLRAPSSAIVNPALCHSGTAPLRSAQFSFVPGQRLEKRFDLSSPPDTGVPDVHGNQVALLERSACFRSSQMTCATCHDVHREQRDVVALSGRCLTCHTVQSCGLFPRRGNRLLGRCVDCHMPLQTSSVLVSTSLGHQLRPQVRTHWIKVYPGQLEP